MKNREDLSKAPVEPQGGLEKGTLVIRFDWYRVILAAIIVFTIFTRFYGLAYKPYHHDESLYATYSWYFYDGRGYTYDPMMHGPFMFHLNALIFTLFGIGDFTARFSAALFGLLLVCCAPLLRKELGKIGSLSAALFFAVSPTYMYFSRFLRHDIYIAFWAFLVVALFMRYIDTRWRGYIYGLAAALAFMFCVKENSYIFLFIYLTFMIIMKLFERFFGSSEGQKEVAPAPETKSRPGLLDIIIAVAIFFGIFYLFYTTFLTNKPGFIDGLYRKSIGYWLHQDKIQRIKGAFTYFCPIAIIYELPLLVILFSGIVALLRKRPLSKIILIVSSVIAIPLMIFWHQTLPVDPWDTVFHMTSSMHIVFAIYIFVLLVTAICCYLKEGRRFHAFLAYWTLMSVLIYSYAGEKVPWLLMHILLPIILWSGIFISEFLRSERFRRAINVYLVLIAVGLLLYLQASIRLCFFNEANPVERMVYTQTSMDIKKSLETISELAEETGKGFNLPIGVKGDSSWPYTWYLRDYKQWFHPGRFTGANKAVVVVDWTKRTDSKSVLEPSYKEKRLKLREWWVPDPVSKLRNPIGAWLAYYFRRDVWSVTGSQDIAFYIRKDLVGEEMGAIKEPVEEPGLLPSPVIPKKYEIIGQIPPILYFGERGSAKGRLNEPRGIWVDKDGAIYVADTKNQRWQKFDKKGNCVLSVGKAGSGPAEFKEPMGIAVDKDGNVYVSDTWNHRIQKFDRDGNFIKQWKGGAGGFWAPKGMAFDSKGDLYVVDTGRHRVQKFARDGKFLLMWGSQGEEVGQFREPVGIAIERNGIINLTDDKKREKQVRGDIIYVADTANKRVQKFDSKGRFLGQFGVLGWEEYYTEPFIALDSQDRVWVTDSRNNRIEVFDKDGTLLGLWSRKGFKPGDFNIPIGIFARDGKICVTDTHTHRIQLFSEQRVIK